MPGTTAYALPRFLHSQLCSLHSALGCASPGRIAYRRSSALCPQNEALNPQLRIALNSPGLVTSLCPFCHPRPSPPSVVKTFTSAPSSHRFSPFFPLRFKLSQVISSWFLNSPLQLNHLQT